MFMMIGYVYWSSLRCIRPYLAQFKTIYAMSWCLLVLCEVGKIVFGSYIVLHIVTSICSSRGLCSSGGTVWEVRKVLFLCVPSLHTTKLNLAYWLMVHCTCFEQYANLYKKLCGQQNMDRLHSTQAT